MSARPARWLATPGSGCPALKIGLNAVYIPHVNTWQLEHEPVVSGSGKLVILPAFRELRNHF